MHLILHLFFVIKLISCHQNNVCYTINDYHTMKHNPNCWYDYDSTHTVPEMITRARRPLEEHKVTTEDGYILTIFRMPNEPSRFKKRYPVFLSHGIFVSAGMWIAMGNRSLAYQLHDQGYDVWLGNSRGTEYSTEHEDLSTYSDDYWDFSVDELALYDLPAVFEYIQAETSQKIIYIGYSLGGSIALMYTSEYPRQAKKYLKFVALAAPAYKLEHHHTLFLRVLAAFGESLYYFAKRFGMVPLLSHVSTTKNIISALCYYSPRRLEKCFKLIYAIIGENTAIQPDTYPIILNQMPGGTSLKAAVHILGILFSKIRKYNYGILKNLAIYGRFSPPEYDVSKIRVPTHIMYSRSDLLITKKDTLDLYNDLSEEARYGIYEIPSNHFNHLDFSYGATCKVLFVDYLLNELEYIGL